MHLYLKIEGSLEDVARKIGDSVLRGWTAQLREGLNLGGGEYYKFARPGSEVLLVCNDEEHPDVFYEERSEFPFYLYCYGSRNGDQVLEEIRRLLDGTGVICEMHEDT